MPVPLKVEITNNDGTVIVKLSGEARLDIEQAAFQLDRVVVHHPKMIIVDATDLSFLSSLGMSLLVNLRRTAVKSGGRIKLAGLQPLIHKSMDSAKLLGLFELFPDLASAVAAP